MLKYHIKQTYFLISIIKIIKHSKFSFQSQNPSNSKIFQPNGLWPLKSFFIQSKNFDQFNLEK